ncbi:hypothetical protein [Caballeronia cordobensis]|uniref:hypothetical protein n=1 Tax=Caballeronia cordobensis TaxID=1353886 RepID=UPI00045F0881|nr:hypothetical protein BRPE67_CCDS10600 [Burkholderia sp. RPE67]
MTCEDLATTAFAAFNADKKGAKVEVPRLMNGAQAVKYTCLTENPDNVARDEHHAPMLIDMSQEFATVMTPSEYEKDHVSRIKIPRFDWEEAKARLTLK